ncbi:MAG: phosphoadenylyl-sulfate reductase [Myxococcales bacterium]|nr:phosphoadenylyl-sulfate reductase [Myxococcales bacterium]MCB9714489.1 phosphoadenylyl-sulfate reductase [Myxococcales bacterium]
MSDPTDIAVLASELEDESPIAILQRALDHHESDEIAIAFSGSEDVMLIEWAAQLGRPFRVFSIDTGRLHPETLRFIQRVEQHYGIRVEIQFPRTEAVEGLVRAKGLFSFYDDGHEECCGIRKVEPLRRKLATLSGWVTGQRRDQSPRTRRSLAVVELDEAHQGKDGRPLIKWNPLCARTSADVWDAIRAFDVPYNSLHDRGFVSVGCEPCTKAILPGQHEREGRWWWEEATKKECGLHQLNVIEPSDD